MAPIPGETKVWQYVTLMKRIYLIDCPGVVPPSSQDTPTDLVLRGVVRVEKVEHPEQYITALLSRVKRHHMEKTYDLKGWQNSTEFLELLARKGGRLLRGGEADLDGVAKMVLNDFMRGKIPWFTPAPVSDNADSTIAGRAGKLGEMPRKRNHEEAAEEKDAADGTDDEEFEGFGSETEETSSKRLSFSATVGTGSEDSSGDDESDKHNADEAGMVGDDASAEVQDAEKNRPNKRPKR